ncbi:hypothetical protein ABET51_06655 [Metabacillus fastidiosus]|uniref:hypothetical protein n=1 Tax=Metabacillus fastidiosus TaxID=1458 RepID=UPI003D2E0D0D
MEQLKNNSNKHLQSQIYLYSVDTSSFYNKREAFFDRKVIKFNYFISNVNKLIQQLTTYQIHLTELIKMEANPNHYNESSNEMAKVLQTKEFKIKLDKLSQLDGEKYEQSLLDIVSFYKNKISEKVIKYENIITTAKKYGKYRQEINNFIKLDVAEKINEIDQFISEKLNVLVEKARKRIKEFEKELTDEKLDEHEGIRELNPKALTSKKKIGQFKSTLTRTLGIEKDSTTTDIIVVRAYRYAVFENIIKNGFCYLNEDYRYFTSSAGQIRQKKSIFVKTKVWEKYKDRIMCGLTIEDINKQGGMNPNKYNAYLALCNTSSVLWQDFSIDKCIVVDDFETLVNGMVDYIDNETYAIDPKSKGVPIPHTDGAGMCLPSVSKKSFQYRMPFFKGLMIPFDYLKFIEDHEGASPIVKDIYGKEWDVIKDGIEIIFTKSQFKAWSFFFDHGKNSWENDYKRKFKLHKCEAAKCKEEDENFEDKRLSYQMLQTLYKMNHEDLEKFCEYTINEIEDINNPEVALRLLGADGSNDKKYGFQRALEVYPAMLNDVYTKEQLKDKRQSLIKDAKAGKILLPGTKRSYIAPDLYSFCERLFLGIEKPNGLLKNGEVSCALFENQKLDVLRSPHLYIEHCIRNNVRNKKTEDWFITNDIYTSTHDLISKQLMFDVDGDDSIIISNPDFIRIAEEHMEGVLPLDYELGTAKPDLITNDNIYKSLKAAYSKNIGEISNKISKCFNKGKDNVNLQVVKWLVMENNAIIDFSKTLWMCERPNKKVEKKIRDSTKGKLPYFFKYAKDKKSNQVEKKNDSVVNMLDKIIPDKRLHFEGFEGEFDYRQLMKNKDQEIEQEIVNLYEELNRKKFKDIKKQLKEGEDKKRKQVELGVYKDIRQQLLELGKKDVVVDVLMKYLYEVKDSKNKQTLWFCFGKEIAKNVEFNILGIKRCEDCDEEIEKVQAKKYCSTCAKKRERDRVRRYRQNKKMNENKVS